jgi:hypothetical protein
MTRSIDAAALDAAERFVRRDARLLDRHRFAHQFRGGPAGAVVAALVPYANPDGGFGNALEPDLRGAASQPEAVAVALRVLDELAPAPGDPDPFAHPLVGRALDWAAGVAAADGGVPWVLPTVLDGPRGPWWQPADGLPGSLVTTGPIAGLAHAHGIEHPWLAAADRFVRSAVEAVAAGTVGIGPYDAVGLLDHLDHAPDRAWAEEAFERVRPALLATVALDPDAAGHVHGPLDLAPAPDGFGRRLFDDDLVELHLDRLVAAQADDGGWHVN